MQQIQSLVVDAFTTMEEKIRRERIKSAIRKRRTIDVLGDETFGKEKIS